MHQAQAQSQRYSLQFLWLEPWMGDTSSIPSRYRRPFFPHQIYLFEDTIHSVGTQWNESFRIQKFNEETRMYQVNSEKMTLRGIHSSILGQLSVIIPNQLFLMEVWSGTRPKTSPKTLLIYKTSGHSHSQQGLHPKRLSEILEEL